MKNKKQNTLLLSIDQKIDYKDKDLLKLFLTSHGKILPQRINRITVQQQKKIVKAIKRARILSILPFMKRKSF